MEQFKSWSRECSQKVLTLVGAGKVEQALDMVTHLSITISENDFPPDVIEASTYTLDFLKQRVDWHPSANGLDKQTCLAAIARFEKPAKGSLGNWERLRRLIIFRVLADWEGFLELSSEEAKDLLEKQDRIEIDISAWHNIAGWAFGKGDRRILERAYELLLTQPSPVLGEAKWQRVNLMYKLMAGKITAKDVEISIQVLEVKPQLDEFLNVFWPRLKELGLTDSRLESLLKGKVGLIGSIAEENPDPKGQGFLHLG